MTMKVWTITPQLAQKMLEGNTANRAIRQTHVDNMARDMRAGAFQLNGDAIRLTPTGVLLDGQHRLWACITADTPFNTYVIDTLSEDTRGTIDSGVKRTHADRLSMRGVTNSSQVSAVARFLGLVALGNLNERFTDRELDTIVDLVPEIHHSSSVVHNVFPKMNRTLGGVHCIATCLGQKEAADAFLGVFKTGIPTYPGDAAHVLRERIISRRAKGNPYTPDELIYATIHMWKHFVARVPVTVIKPSEDITIKGWTTARLGLVRYDGGN